MQKNTKIIILVLFVTSLFSVKCSASENITKINDLVENSIALDNTEVTVRGEVIGEELERGDYAWININDTTNAIGIWVSRDDISQVKNYGDYKHKGDIVKVTGIFYRACPEHGGDVDIHCSNIEVVEAGHINKEQLSSVKVISTCILTLTAIITVFIYLKLRKKEL